MIDTLPIWTQALIVFVSYFCFIYLRTSNVIHTTERNIIGSLVSGGLVHIAHLIATGLGINAILSDLTVYYPVLIGSLTGGLLGTYVGIKTKQKQDGRKANN